MASSDAAHRLFEIGGDLRGGSFGGLEGDVAGKALGDDNVDDAFADAVALHEAAVIETGQVEVAQQGRCGLHFLDALDFFGADIEQADGRALKSQDDPRHRRAHDRKIDEVAGVGAHRGADVEHDGLPP